MEACVRESEDTRWLFLENFTGEPQTIALPEGYEDLDGAAVQEARLAGYDSQVFLKKR